MKVNFFTLGCKVNQYETQGLIEKFLSLGWETVTGGAELCVVNTCTVTHRADTKSREAILRAKKANPGAKIAVCGCLPQLNKDFIEKIGVDYIVPQETKHLLPEIASGMPIPKEMPKNDKGIWSLKITHFLNHRAFVKVQDGCSSFCSFCKSPYLIRVLFYYIVVRKTCIKFFIIRCYFIHECE